MAAGRCDAKSDSARKWNLVRLHLCTTEREEI